MKVLVKYAWFIPVICSVALGCTENDSTRKESIVIKKITIDDDFIAAEKPWGISDGIKVTGGNKTEYFVFDIESPPGAVKNKAEVRFTYRLDSLDNTVQEKTLTHSVDSLYPFYVLNSLEVFNVDGRYGAYFYASLLGYPYGMDPYELIMWVYYDEQLYKFSGIVSPHPDWPWEETYSFTPDERLKSVSTEVYQQITDIWNEHIEKYKKRYNNN